MSAMSKRGMRVVGAAAGAEVELPLVVELLGLAAVALLLLLLLLMLTALVAGAAAEAFIGSGRPSRTIVKLRPAWLPALPGLPAAPEGASEGHWMGSGQFVALNRRSPVTIATRGVSGT